MRKKLRLSSVAKYVFLVITMAAMMYPVIMVILNSVKSESELYANVLGLPQNPLFKNYVTAIKDGKLIRALVNSIIISFGSVALTTVLGSFAAYALTRFRGPVQSSLYWLFAAGIMIPYQVGLSQLYNITLKLGLMDSYIGLILIFTAWSLPFTVFVMYGSFSTIPNEIFEAAILDGCSPYKLYGRVVLPLSSSVLSATIIYNLVFVWNDMMYPMIFIDSKTLKPLSTALLAFQGQFMSRYTIMFAGVVLSSLPLVIVYLSMQKRFVEGMTIGAVKG